MTSNIAPAFLLFSTLLLAMLNLLVPFISKDPSKIRSFLLIMVSSFFLINVLIIDWLFLSGIRINLSIAVFNNYHIGLYLEPLGLIFLTLLSSLTICALLYSDKYLLINSIKQSSKFLFFLNLSVLSAVFISLSSNLFTMFVFYEILTITTAFLIAHSGGDKVMAGLHKYLKILMISGMLLFLPAILIIYAKANHGDFLPQGFVENYFSKNQTILLLLMFIFGIAKAALYPVHQWLPAAMVANYPVSALLHAVVVVKTGLFCIYKILLYVFGLKYLQSIFTEFNWLVFLPIITILYSSYKALQSNNIKKILAYSTINQLSIALLSAFMLTPKSMAAAILHLVSHSFSKICLFYGMGNIYSLLKTNQQRINQIEDLLGASRTMPKTSLIILISSLSLMGIPPFGGFISKFYIMLAAAEQDQILVMITLALSSVLSALYLVKFLTFIYKPVIINNILVRNIATQQSQKFDSVEHKLPFTMLVSLIICSLGVVLFGFIQSFVSKFLMYVG